METKISEQVQPSPAVAVPDAHWAAIEVLRENLRDPNRSVKIVGIRDNDKTRDAINVLLSTPTPPSSEQPKLDKFEFCTPAMIEAGISSFKKNVYHSNLESTIEDIFNAMYWAYAESTPTPPSSVFDEGIAAYNTGKGISDNPYVAVDFKIADEWMRGYEFAGNKHTPPSAEQIPRGCELVGIDQLKRMSGIDQPDSAAVESSEDYSPYYQGAKGSLWYETQNEDELTESSDINLLQKTVFNLFEDIRCLKEFYAEKHKPQRITEQDARDILVRFTFFRLQGHAMQPLDIIEKWLIDNDAIELLAKLNEHKGDLS